jgi:4-hydroxybenzoate polyprenyltransferase
VRFLRALSLDVVAGAACGGLLAESATSVRMLPAWWVALLAAVWSVYTGDHLLDALRASRPLATHRHAFHRRHARVLTVALAIAIAIGLMASLELRPPVRLFGFVVGGLVLVYLASAQGLLLPTVPKEVMAGALYAVGIWGGPLIMSERPSTWQLCACGLQALAAILNLATLGVFEMEVDDELGSRSLALRAGPRHIRRGVLVASAVGAALAVTAGLLAPHPAFSTCVVLAIQIALPGVMLVAFDWFKAAERYRAWGDCVFLLGAFPRLLR